MPHFPVRGPSGDLTTKDAVADGAGRHGTTGARSWRMRLRSLGSRLGLLWVLIALFVLFSIWLPHTFLTLGNVQTMVNSQAVILILAIAATMPLRAGDFDFSIAAVMTASTATVIVLVSHGQSLALAVFLALGLGLVVGVVNALLIVKIGVDSLITTLGMLTALGGYAYAITNSNVIVVSRSAVLGFARDSFAGFPAATWYAWVLVVVAWYVYEKTPLGRYLIFIGGNREAAKLAGVRVSGVRGLALLTSALLSAFAGIVLAGQLGAIDPSIGSQYLLQPFAAALLGATTVTIGRPNALGTLIALYLLVIGVTGLELLGASSWANDVFNGLALVVAVTVAKLAAGSRQT
jgi:ribose transport system permease protein